MRYTKWTAIALPVDYTKHDILISGGSRAAVTSKMERFVIKVNGFQPLTIITKRFILDVAAALNPALLIPCCVTHFSSKRFIVDPNLMEMKALTYESTLALLASKKSFVHQKLFSRDT